MNALNQIGRTATSSNGGEIFPKSFYNEVKPFKPNQTPIDQRSFNMSVERALTKSNDTKNSSAKTLSLWDSMYNSQSSHSNSKESLWTSAQSSPNSVQREQLKQQLFTNASNLWENPSSKQSQASLMSNNSNNSIWYTPPRMQSPPAAVANNTNGWENSNAFLTPKKDELLIADDVHSLLRPQDLSPNDRWNGGGAVAQKINANEAKWNANASFNRVNNSNVFTSTPIKPVGDKSIAATAVDLPTHNKNVFAFSEANDFYNSISTPSATAANAPPASSSCLQLFSDEFINYLNMIN